MNTVAYSTEMVEKRGKPIFGVGDFEGLPAIFVLVAQPTTMHDKAPTNNNFRVSTTPTRKWFLKHADSSSRVKYKNNSAPVRDTRGSTLAHRILLG